MGPPVEPVTPIPIVHSLKYVIEKSYILKYNYVYNQLV